MATKKQKISEQDKIESHNSVEAAKVILENCIKCGMCKSLCPVFKTLKEESVSPRGHSILINNDVIEETLFQCTLCKACEQKCPLKLKICDAVRKGRESLTLKNKNLKSNEEMMKNVRKHGNPFGNGPIEKDKLYCC
jgi:Fe-S oxidoreductase